MTETGDEAAGLCHWFTSSPWLCHQDLSAGRHVSSVVAQTVLAHDTDSVLWQRFSLCCYFWMVCWFISSSSAYKDLTLWIWQKVPYLCQETSAWKVFCVQTINDYTVKSIVWKWDWSSVVLQLLLHRFSASSPCEMSPHLPMCKTMLTWTVLEGRWDEI